MTVNKGNQDSLSKYSDQGSSKKSRHYGNEMKKLLKKILPALALVIVILLILSPLVLMSDSNNGAPINVIYGLEEIEEELGDPKYTEAWDGRGTDSEDCELSGEGPRNAEDGWIHWVFSTKGDSTDARLVLEGTGSGTYEPGEPLNAEVWHFYTPYFELDELEATINLYGGEEGSGGGLVISDYCPGNGDPEDPETASLTIEKLLKQDVDDEELIQSDKTFTFNIYDNDTDELVREGVEVEVVDGEGSVLVDELPLGTYRVEEVASEAYEVVLDPADGVVDLTEPGNDPVTIEVVNTPRPVLIIEKVLQDADEEVIEDSDVEFTVILDGGTFDDEEITFSVNDPAVLDHTDGLEFDVEYTVTEAAHEDYELVSISPSTVTLTDEENEVTVTIVNREEEPEEPETASLTIEKLLKQDVDDEETIQSDKTFTFNIYDNDTDELVREGVEVEVVDGEGSVLVDELPLGTYRVEEVASEAYEAVLDPADGIVDLTEPGNEPVTIEVVNTPRPVLIIEKVLQDDDEEVIEDSDVEFTVILDGGAFDEEEITFSVNDPAVLDHTDGLEFDVEYTVTEAAHEDYELVSISPDQPFVITDEDSTVTVVVTNEETVNGNDEDNGNGEGGTISVFVQPPEPETEPEEEAEEEEQVEPEEPEVEPVVEEEEVVEPEEPATEPEEVEEVVVEPEEPETEPEEEELVVEPEAPLTTPVTDGRTHYTLFYVGALLAIGGFILRKYALK